MTDNNTQTAPQTEDVEMQNEIKLDGQELETVQAGAGPYVDFGGLFNGVQEHIKRYGPVTQWRSGR